MKEIKRKLLPSALVQALGAGVALTVVTTGAYAQQAQRVEKIEVTGSNIKRVDQETVAPIEIITRDRQGAARDRGPPPGPGRLHDLGGLAGVLRRSGAQAVPGPKGDTDAYQIEFSLKKNGADKFGAWTAANINSYIAVALNDEVKSIAFIKGQIFDRGEINGHFTRETAEDLALVLRSGSLPALLKIISEETIK